MITRIGGVQLSRQMVTMLSRADDEAASEQRAAERAAEHREEEWSRNLQRYYQEHGEWPYETRAREQATLARQAATEERERADARAEARQAVEARWLMEGRRPRTHEEILAAARAIS
jgi:hypothetical protein